MGLRSETTEQDVTQASVDFDDFDFEAFIADPDKFDRDAEEAIAIADRSPPLDPDTHSGNIKDLVVGFEAEVQRCAEQLAAARPFFAEIMNALDASEQRETRLTALDAECAATKQALETANVGLARAVKDLEATRAALEIANKQIHEQAESLEAASKTEKSLRDEIAALAAELVKTREVQTATSDRLDKVTAFCRRAHAAMKSALGARDEIEIRMKRHQAGEASALRRVAELSNLNEELETRLRVPAAKPRPAPQASESVLGGANDG